MEKMTSVELTELNASTEPVLLTDTELDDVSGGLLNVTGVQSNGVIGGGGATNVIGANNFAVSLL